jgi:hypothetical protein
LSEFQELTLEQSSAAEQLVASRLAAMGIKQRGEIKVVATKYHDGSLIILYLHDGKRSLYVVRGVPEKDEL